MNYYHRFTFSHPTTVVMAGPTMSGKTHFLARAVTESRFEPPPQRIVVVYGEMQPAYVEMARRMPHIEFYNGYSDKLYATFDPQVRNLLILDDQMHNKAAVGSGGRSATKSKCHSSNVSSATDGCNIAKFFTQGAHHRNLTVVYMVQNVFNQDKVMRNCSLNAHYFVIFRNPADATQIRTLSYRMYPDDFRFLLEAYNDATSKPYGHLVINLRPQACEALRVQTNVFDDPVAYVQKRQIEKAKPTA